MFVSISGEEVWMRAQRWLLIACCFVFVSACAGPFPNPMATSTPVPAPVVTVTLPSISADLSMECNIPAIWLFISDTETKLAEISDRNFFQELGEKPSKLNDKVFIEEAITISEARLAYLVEKSTIPGPQCVAEYRALQLQQNALILYFWQLLEVGNLEEAGKVDDQIVAISERMRDILKEFKEALEKP
jgi:hypothetical protein